MKNKVSEKEYNRIIKSRSWRKNRFDYEKMKRYEDQRAKQEIITSVVIGILVIGLIVLAETTLR